jgi:hypothetical protein
MSRGYRYLSTLLLAGAITAPAMISGCAAHAEYRVYDPYYSDYHTWNHDEVVYYNQWETETHRQHVDFKKRNSDEQKQYWDWRHKHEH